MAKKPKSDSYARKKRKYRAKIARAILMSTPNPAKNASSAQRKNPGRGWIYSMNGTVFSMSIDLSTAEQKLSKSGQTYLYASTLGQYGLQDFGYPDLVVNASLYRDRRIDERIEVEAMKRYIATLEPPEEREKDA